MENDLLDGFLSVLAGLVRPGVTVAIVVLVLAGTRKLLDRTAAKAPERGFRNQLIMLGLSLAGLLTVVLSLPVDPGTKQNLINLLGLLLSAAIALSATTILGNVMGGLQLRAVRNFRTGDFISVDEHFGRVSERGLVHTEIQTEDRDLVTLPNMFLITRPVRVIRSSGTIVSATVSLGYDAPRGRVEELLLAAAREVELDEPFVQVLELDDFSVTYRVAGLLQKVKQIVSFRSGLRKAVMDTLHEGGIEIVSPTFMNQRQLSDEAVIPARSPARHAPLDSEAREGFLFDKAEEAQALESRRQSLSELDERLAQLRKQVSAVDEAQRPELERIVSHLEAQRAAMEHEIDAREGLMKDLDSA